MVCLVLVLELLEGASVVHLKQRLVHSLPQTSLAATILTPDDNLKMQKTFLPSADLEGECIVANLEVAADGDQGAVPVDFKLCHG